MRIKESPSLDKLMQDALSDSWDVPSIMVQARAESKRTDRYLAWNELRFRKAPEALSEKQWWLGLKLQRLAGREPISLQDTTSQQFSYSMPQCMLKLLHEIDILGTSCKPNPEMARSGHSYLLNRLEQESITSSMLEGAVTTRAQAKEMLRHKRKPVDTGERMVLNNYATMQEIGRIKDDAFTVEKILQLHRMLCLDTLDDAQMCGSFRREKDAVRVEDARTGDTVHTPPPAHELPLRLQGLCHFANAQDQDYTHPIIRACIIHFWLAYDHPFIDGNGRTARALFYWYMLKSGYSQYEYISISSEILKHPKRYYQSFIDTEEDEGDMNYFIFQQLNTIKAAIENLRLYLEEKGKEHEDKLTKLSSLPELNIRQKSIYAELLKAPDSEIGVSYVSRRFSTVRQTARTDLNLLESLGLVKKQKRGKTHIYRLN